MLIFFGRYLQDVHPKTIRSDPKTTRKKRNEQWVIEKDIQNLKVFPITEKISNYFIDLMINYSLSHNLDLPDALIASTAIINDLELYTLNLKHFKYIQNLKLWRC